MKNYNEENLKNLELRCLNGIKVYEGKINIEEIKNNPPYSKFVVFSLSENTIEKFFNGIVKDEYILETLPYRIFVVKDKDEGELESEFLKKRICILSYDEWKEIKKYVNNKKPREAVVELYKKWIEHLASFYDKKDPQFEVWIKIHGQLGKTLPEPVREKYENIVRSLFPLNSQSKPSNSEILSNYFINVKFIDELSQELPQDKIVILYTRHAQERELINSKGYFYYEDFSGDSPSFSMYYHWPQDEIEKKLRACLLVENALLGLMIVDERAFKAVSNYIENRETYFNLMKLFFINKFIGDKEVTVCELQNYTVSYNIKKSNKIKIQNSFIPVPKLSFLVIHQGVLDKAFSDSSQKNLEEKVNKLKEVFPFIVVTSGRGKPQNLPKNSKFILLSDILANLRKADYPDKLGIINILMNIGK